MLDVGPLRLSPQPTRVFRQGDTVHLLFDVYNPAAADLAAGPQGPRVALLLNGKPVAAQRCTDRPSRTRSSAGSGTPAIATRGLAAGSYTVIVALPREDASGPKPLLQVFMLLPS